MSDVTKSIDMFPEVDFRYIIGPSESLSESFIPLDFSPENIERQIAIGYKDAEAAVKLGPHGYRDTMVDYSDRKYFKREKGVKLGEMLQKKLEQTN